jgi:lysophospholipase L1-like esterase
MAKSRVTSRLHLRIQGIIDSPTDGEGISADGVHSCDLGHALIGERLASELRPVLNGNVKGA